MARTRTTRGSAARRRLVWADTNITEATTAAQQGTDLLASYRGTAGATGSGLTVMGVIIQQNAGATGGTATFTTAVRIGLVVSDASAEADLPDVVTEPDADWLWNSQYYLTENALGAAMSPEDRSLRIKSRRKVQELGQSLWLAFQPRLGGVTTIAYDAHVRVLLALP